VLSNASLTGAYSFRHVLLVSDATGGLADARTSFGTLTFDGRGGFTLAAQQLVRAAAAVSLTGSGAYSVGSGGVVSLTSPQFGPFAINARLGVGALVGAATEAGATIFDTLVAIPAATAQTNAALNGPYFVSSLEFPAGATTNVRNASFKLTANGAGAFAETSITGQARSGGNRLLTQSIPAPTYQVGTNGATTLNIALGSGQTEASQVLSGPKTIYVASDGTYFVGGSTAAGGHGLVVGVKARATGATNASWNGFYYQAGLRFDADRGRFSSGVGTINGTSAGAVMTRRVRQSDGVFDASVVANYDLSPDGGGYFSTTLGRVNVSANGNQFATSGVANSDSNSYELSFGVRMSSVSGTGVFIDPQRVLNGASFALGYPVTPGGFVTLFGSGLAQTTATAPRLPFTATLAGVTATVNGRPAPLYLVSPTQISLIVPYGLAGTTATIIVTSNNVASNAVDVPLAPSAPGVFSLTQNGLGDGAILRVNNSVLTTANPALPGEIIQVFLSGMGAVTPVVVEGAISPAANVAAPTAVTIGGRSAEILYNGLAPGLAGLYQLNVRVPQSTTPGPQSLAIQTPDGFSDMVNVRIGRP
jgi:uncharacterized protein (TIGR03437 family)